MQWPPCRDVHPLDHLVTRCSDSAFGICIGLIQCCNTFRCHTVCVREYVGVPQQSVTWVHPPPQALELAEHRVDRRYQLRGLHRLRQIDDLGENVLLDVETGLTEPMLPNRGNHRHGLWSRGRLGRIVGRHGSPLCQSRRRTQREHVLDGEVQTVLPGPPNHRDRGDAVASQVEEVVVDTDRGQPQRLCECRHQDLLGGATGLARCCGQ